ncbi:hypothetical protein HK096_008075, partial [Nowakowskiella sp. JEL0078]
MTDLNRITENSRDEKASSNTNIRMESRNPQSPKWKFQHRFLITSCNIVKIMRTVSRRFISPEHAAYFGNTIPKIPVKSEWHWALKSPASLLAQTAVISAVAVRDRGDRPLITYSNHNSLLDDPVFGSVTQLTGLFSLLPWDVLNPQKIRWTLGSRRICFSSTPTALFFRAGKAFPTSDGEGIYQGAMEVALKKLNNGEW